MNKDYLVKMHHIYVNAPYPQVEMIVQAKNRVQAFVKAKKQIKKTSGDYVINSIKEVL